MKIISWNCNGALRKKLLEIDSLEADILVIQECEDPAQSTKAYKEWAGDYLWVGESKNKGIGIFPKNNNIVKKLEWFGEFKLSGVKSNSKSLNWSTNSLRLFLPFVINEKINALGVWTKGKDNEVFGYIGQFWKYFQIHKNNLARTNQIIIGDFNSNKIWDKTDRWWNHSDVINDLESIDIHSLYHHQFGEEQGNESHPTFYLHRNEEKPYHIDYAFVSKEYLNSNLELGEKEMWLSVSDHLPIILNLQS